MCTLLCINIIFWGYITSYWLGMLWTTSKLCFWILMCTLIWERGNSFKKILVYVWTRSKAEVLHTPVTDSWQTTNQHSKGEPTWLRLAFTMSLTSCLLSFFTNITMVSFAFSNQGKESDEIICDGHISIKTITQLKLNINREQRAVLLTGWMDDHMSQGWIQRLRFESNPEPFTLSLISCLLSTTTLSNEGKDPKI